MTKTFNHQVIYNGALYPANTPILKIREELEIKDDKRSKKGGAKNEDDKEPGGKS